MSSTTLMTFLLSINPQIKSVKLYGSWDNFSKPYVMERDKRIGPGQWRGCYSFTDIICDGSTRDMSSTRSGGLKMGGTYWYYYLLDDDLEHYNVAEPVTSLCPLLPGQPVNVLQVPVILPDTRAMRTTEDGSANVISDQRTMNPEDKYMNPRRPPKPKLRLRTSPPLLQQSTPNWSFSTSPLNVITNKCVSQPGSASKIKREEQKMARSVSPPKSRGLRAAIRQWNSSSPDLNATYKRDDDFLRPTAAHGHTAFGKNENNRLGVGGHSRMGSDNTTAHLTVSRRSNHQLPRRPVSTGECNSMSLSIRDRRALNSKSAEHVLHLNPLTVQTKPKIKVSGIHSVYSHVSKGSSSSLDFLSLQPTATLPYHSEDAMTPTPFDFQEKRLPTLPNSPSSVMDEALRDLDERERELDTENLGSHFSDFSATDDSIAGDSMCERSHFSEWSTDTELISPESMESSLMFNREGQNSPVPDTLEVPDLWKNGALAEFGDPGTPNLTVTSKLSPTTIGGDSPRLDLPPPQLSGPFSPSDLDVPGLCIEDVDEVERNPKRHAAFFGAVESLEALGLARSPDASSIHFPEGLDNSFTSLDDVKRDASRDSKTRSKSSFPGASATMQEMMDELSYLKNMIQSGTGGVEQI